MSTAVDAPSVDDIMATCTARDKEQTEFLQAVDEVLTSLRPLLDAEPKYRAVLARLVEPERVIMFRVAWTDDAGRVQINRGYRIQFNSALGPYKGGLRFHPSVNLSILKFLGFEQTFKNALTTLMLGGGKGGSDFDPKGKSDREVMAFCQAFMTELARHVGPDTDVPAGDIGVGAREVGYLFGQYKRLTATFTGVLTGKGASWGGSLMRPEATGYGVVYFGKHVVEANGESLRGKRVAVSGAGNVALFTMEKLLALGAVPVSCSDSGGCVVEPAGFTPETLKTLMDLKARHGRLSEFPALSPTAEYVEGQRPWAHTAYDMAIPCATQNEVHEGDAAAVIAAGCKYLVEGANMPCTPAAITALKASGVAFAPAKAANAGGVTVSGLEMAQDSQRLKWTAEQVDDKLQDIMAVVYSSCVAAAARVGAPGDLQVGSNVAGFLRVADAMLAQGVL